MHRTVAAKLNLLKMAPKLGVSRACRKFGFSRSHYYRLLDRYKRNGKAGLRNQSRRKPLDRVFFPEVDNAVLALTCEHPDWTAYRIARDSPVSVSPTGVRGVWRRNNITTADQRAAFAAVPGRKNHLPTKKRGQEGPPPGAVTIMNAKGEVLRVIHPDSRGPR